jgi:hypothetical protein
MDALDNYMLGEDYEISSKSRESVILASRTYTFTNASHNKDNIKVVEANQGIYSMLTK